MVKGLTRAFSCRIFAGRKQTLNTATMDFKRIAHNAVRRWNEKRTARKTMGTTHIAIPQAETLPKAANLESALGSFLAERYEFRFNVLTEATEFRCLSDEGNGTFRPVTERDLNAICLEAHRHGIDCWDRDVARMVHSADVREYHPFRQYFQRLPTWDGRDRLHGLATRVSDSPLWIQTFHRWMLGLAAQWAGLSDGLHAHSTAPLLVSDEQGLGKSTFCRALLPPQLQAYYTDSVDLARPDKVERQLTEMGLLNLDEFDRIPEKKHPLLKNLMQLSALNLRKAYRRHSQALPRIASFIGTSNSRELLSDPSGSRRFICVLVEHPIDSTGIDHAQIYAQLKAELERGERYWFSHGEENALRLHNAAFYRICPAGEVLRPLLSCGSAEREGTPAFAARNIRTVAAVGTRSDGRRDAAETISGPCGRRGTEDTHALWKPIPRGGIVISHPYRITPFDKKYKKS